MPESRIIPINDQDTKSPAELKRFAISVYRRRWWVAGGTLLSTLLGLTLAFVVKPTYLAETTLVPAQSQMSAGRFSGALGQFGGLTNMIGLQGATKPTVIEAIALLKSRHFTDDFIREHHLLPVLFPDKWNANARQWKRGVRPPNLWDGYRLFNREIRFVDQNRRTGIVTLRIEWHNRVKAAEWANELVEAVNERMRQRTLAETRTTLKYLKAQLSKTHVVPVQNALQDLIEENLKREAMAAVRPDYVFRVVDPAAPADPRRPLRPHKLLYVIIGFFFGLVLSLLGVLTADAVRVLRSWIGETRTSQ